MSSSQQTASSIQRRSKSSKLVKDFNFDLPDECWESIFKFIIRDDENYIYLDSISIVSKQFLSITDGFRFSLSICCLNISPLFQRFTNLVSLNLSRFCGDINRLLKEISRFPLKITSLNISFKPIIPDDGLRAFSQNITTLTSLTWTSSKSIGTVMFLIADCFPLLEELDLRVPTIESEENYESLLDGVKALSSKLFKLRKFLEEAIILNCDQITKAGVVSALRERQTLRSLSFNRETEDNATFFALINNGPSLREISLGYAWEDSVENSIPLMDVALLNLSYSRKISEKVPKLEVLNLSHTKVDDKTLYVISKHCRGLLQLLLDYCNCVTEKGVKHVIENCTQLREIKLPYSYNVGANVVASMVISRPSWREIATPSSFNFLELPSLYHISILNLSKKVNLTGHRYINHESLFHLFKNWKFLEEAIILYCDQITNAGVVSALRERPTLRSLSFNREMEDNVTFFALINNGPSLREISFGYAWKNSVENSIPLMDVAVIPQLKSLCLEDNPRLSDERIKIFVSLFPNLQLLNLSYCKNISEEVPKLEVLNLSRTKVDDKTLYVISKHCRGLLQLLLDYCCHVTDQGVKHVIENCTQLREINLSDSPEVVANVVASMVFSRPSWREITTPSSFNLLGKNKFYLRKGYPSTSILKIL
ncbi:hypothetical protein TSUD_166280 [Trifolium subterraneum]|uniref:F-box domain-containing protein n=1 Tax=Trifolium subterraneum TaxID=3900 RepID=A0A2Z6NIN7_TRISU|nr:hypothetical protein TSUD_166280 [Trifolium subterraneum]